LDIFKPEEACFCGSGRLFSDCHEGKVYRHPAEIDVDFARFRQNDLTCGMMIRSVRCGKPAISSHSIQRQGSLREISENSHVLTFSANKYGKSDPQNRETTLTPVSIKKASTFKALCAEHDHQAFKRIETLPLDADYRTCLELGYRSTLFEAMESTRSATWMEWLSRKAKYSFHFNAEVVEPELENMKFYAGYTWELLKRLGAVSSRKTIRKFRFVAVEFLGNLNFCATGCFCIETGFTGHRIQNFSSIGAFNYAQLSIVKSSETSWFFVLSALEDQNSRAAQAFLRSLLVRKNDDLAWLALNSALCHVENIYFRPSWIASLQSNHVKEIIDRFEYGVGFLVGQTKRETVLSETSEIPIDAKVVSVRHNLPSA
jgi:hypothetical protein